MILVDCGSNFEGEKKSQKGLISNFEIYAKIGLGSLILLFPISGIENLSPENA